MDIDKRKKEIKRDLQSCYRELESYKEKQKKLEQEAREQDYYIDNCKTTMRLKEKELKELKEKEWNQRKFIITHEQLKTLTDYDKAECMRYKQKVVSILRDVTDCEVEKGKNYVLTKEEFKKIEGFQRYHYWYPNGFVIGFIESLNKNYVETYTLRGEDNDNE